MTRQSRGGRTTCASRSHLHLQSFYQSSLSRRSRRRSKSALNNTYDSQTRTETVLVCVISVCQRGEFVHRLCTLVCAFCLVWLVFRLTWRVLLPGLTLVGLDSEDVNPECFMEMGHVSRLCCQPGLDSSEPCVICLSRPVGSTVSLLRWDRLQTPTNLPATFIKDE